MPNKAFGMMNVLIDKNIEFITNNMVVFICGCNLVCYDLDTEESRFLKRNHSNCRITSLSISYKGNNMTDPLICIGEFNENTKMSQISVISVNKPKTQYTLTKTQSGWFEWEILKAIILKNSANIISIAKKSGTSSCKISIWKYNKEKFISEVMIDENITYISYNPRNPFELIFSGKGYIRLWNFFSNEGLLKEHPQRFLKGKDEKEHNFIKSQFYDNKPFMFIAATDESQFFIKINFQVLYKFNVIYNPNDICDLDIASISQISRDDAMLSKNNITLDTDNTVKTNKTKTTTSKNNNSLASFFLINNDKLLLAYKDDPITFTRGLESEKDIKKILIGPMVQDEEEEDILEKKPHKVFRLTHDIKSILNVIANSDYTRIIYLVEVVNITRSSICIYQFKRNGMILDHPQEIFKEYFSNDPVSGLDINERKKIIFSLTSSNWLRCWEYNKYKFMLKHHFKDKVNHIRTCQHIFKSSYSLIFIVSSSVPY